MAAFVFLILTQIIFCAATDWSYSRQDKWPTACDGREQSPIEITSRKIVSSCFEDFKFSSATNEKKKATVTNTGHSIELRFLNHTTPPTVSGGGLDGEYVLEAFHFHWPSEHTVDEIRYPLEGHFVYYSKKYGSLKDALQYWNGVAVIGVFYSVMPSFEDTNVLFSFLGEIPFVANTINQPFLIEAPLVLKDFFPEAHNEFYRYNGSLTTPNCNEGVIWTLFKRRKLINFSEFDKLIRIFQADGKPLKSNHRMLQKLNGRQVFASC